MFYRLFILPSGSAHDDRWIQPDIEFDLREIQLDESTLKNFIEKGRECYQGFFK